MIDPNLFIVCCNQYDNNAPPPPSSIILNEKIKCPICKQKFLSNKLLVNHLKLSHQIIMSS